MFYHKEGSIKMARYIVKVNGKKQMLMPKICILCGEKNGPFYRLGHYMRTTGFITYKNISLDVPVCKNCNNLISSVKFAANKEERNKNFEKFENKFGNIFEKLETAMSFEGATKQSLFKESFIKFSFGNKSFAEEFARINNGELKTRGLFG